MIAARSALPRYLVLLAGTGVPGAQIADAQVQAMLRLTGEGEAAITRAQTNNRKIRALVLSESDPKVLEEKLKVALANDPEALRIARPQIEPANGCMREFLTLDPRTFLVPVEVPVLALNGERDIQIDATTHLGAIDKALRDAGDEHVTIVKLPELNHLFQHAKTGS